MIGLHLDDTVADHYEEPAAVTSPVNSRRRRGRQQAQQQPAVAAAKELPRPVQAAPVDSKPLAPICRSGKGSARTLKTKFAETLIVNPGAVERLERLLAAAADEKESGGLGDSASLEETSAWFEGERDRVVRRRAAATAALLLLEEGRFPDGGGSLKEEVLGLAGQLDGRLSSLADLIAACR